MPLVTLILGLHLGYVTIVALAAYPHPALRETATFLMGLALAHSLVLALSRRHAPPPQGFLPHAERSSNLLLLIALIASGWLTGFLAHFLVTLASEAHRPRRQRHPAAP